MLDNMGFEIGDEGVGALIGLGVGPDLENDIL